MTQPASPAEQGPSTIRLFDKNGTAVDVPHDQAAAAVQSGQLGAPVGTQIPVRMGGKVGSVPIEHLTKAVEGGAQVVSHEDLQKAELQAKYGDIGHALEAGGVSALNTATLGLSNLAIAGIGGKAAREHVRNIEAANPTATTVGGAVGAIAPIALSGGLGAAGEAAEAAEGVGALAEGAEAVKGASTLGTVARAAGKAAVAPSELVSGLGGAVEGAVHKGIASLVGGEATSLAGKIGMKGAEMAARGAVEGALFGGGQELGEEALGDPGLNGGKLWAAMGHGALLGAGLGGGLAATGELGRAVLGEVAPRLKSLADEQIVRALNPNKASVREMVRLGEEEGIHGGVEAVADRIRTDVGIKAGESMQDIAPRIDAAYEKAGAKVGDVLEAADAAGHEGPSVKGIYEGIKDRILPRYETLPSLSGGVRSKVQGIIEDVNKIVGIPTEEAAAAAGVDRAAMLDQAKLSFQQAHEIRARIDDAINWTKNPRTGKYDEVGEALKSVRRSFEDEIENAAGKATKEMGGTVLEEYKDAKQAYRELSVAKKMVDNARLQIANRAISPSDYGTGLAVMAVSLAHGNLPGMAMGLASTVGHKLLRERGNATAAVVLDKLSALGGIQRAVSALDREIDRGVVRAAGNSERALPRLKQAAAGLPESYEAKRAAIIRAASQAEEHGADIERAIAPVAEHAPLTARSFQSAALRATVYLAKALPQHPVGQSMAPRLDEQYEPSDAEKSELVRKFDAINDPPSVLAHIDDGTITPDEVEALEQGAPPGLLPEMREKLKEELQGLKHDIPYDRKLAIETFMGEPFDYTMTPEMVRTYQASFAQSGTPAPPSGKGGRGGKRGASAPKRELKISKTLGLTGLSKELGS